MVGMMMVPICAEEISVNYKEPNTYTVSIPKSIQLSKNGNTPNDVKIMASDVNIEPKGEIKVSIISGIENGILNLDRKDDTSTKVQTTVTANGIADPITTNTVIATFRGDHGETVTGGTLAFSKVTNVGNDATIKAGTYTGTVEFAITGPEK